MALKDWKKDKKYDWLRKDKKESITLRGYGLYNVTGYGVIIAKKKSNRIATKLYNFSTLKRALSFVKDYMKKH